MCNDQVVVLYELKQRVNASVDTTAGVASGDIVVEKVSS
jgi:hypothetical protein